MKKRRISVYLTLFFLFSSVFLFSGCGEKEMIYSSIEMSWAGPVYDDLESMQADSELVILGTPTAIEGSRGIDIISLVTIQVDEIIKGEPIDSIVLYQYGGTYRNEITLPPEEFPLLEVGQQYLLYVNKTIRTNSGEWYYMVTGGFQGVARHQDDKFIALVEANHLFEAP